MAKKYEHFSIELDNLETEVKGALFMELHKSNTMSKHLNQKCLKVNVFDYRELVYLNGKLIFISWDGLHFDIDCDCTLTDWIDILNSL
jgi:hypothetical protein